MYLMAEEQTHDIYETMLSTQMKCTVSAIIAGVDVTSAHKKKLHGFLVTLPNCVVQRPQACQNKKLKTFSFNARFYFTHSIVE